MKRRLSSDGDDDVIKKVPKIRGVAQMQGPSLKMKIALRIVTDISTVEMKSPALDELLSSTDSDDDEDSLFDEPPPRLFTPEFEDICSVLTSETTDESVSGSGLSHLSMVVARRTAPPIHGLYFDPNILLPEDLGEEIMWKCIRAYFQTGTSDQVMLFERASPASSSSVSPTGLPPFLCDLLSLLQDLLRPLVPPETHELLFSPSPASHLGPPRARQAIINLYWPGDGITPHVDLLSRYSDGIIGVSLGSGCAIEFAKAPDRSESESDPAPSPSEPYVDCPSAPFDKYALYLPKGSVVVLTQAARYDWTHGIEKRLDDLVEEPGSVTARSELLERDVRLSVTFRWMLPGAEVVGSAASREPM